MKKIVLMSVVAILASMQIIAQDLKVDEILEKFYQATGYNKLQNVKTITMTGTMSTFDNMPIQVIKMRPDKYIMIYDVQDITAYQAYDGKQAWSTAPWTGNAKPQLIPAERAKDLIARADFDGTIYNWKAKGHQVELIGNDTVNKQPTYKIKLTRKDGGIEYYSIGKKDFLLQKRLNFRKIGGKEIKIENFYSDYRNVEGAMFAFISENKTEGQPYSTTIQFDKVELNKPIDEKIFEFPIK